MREAAIEVFRTSTRQCSKGMMEGGRSAGEVSGNGDVGLFMGFPSWPINQHRPSPSAGLLLVAAQ
jgi:hypothetical protein